MGTNYIAPIWRMPRNANTSKLSNYSINFSGTNEYININPGASSTVDLTSFTISTWVKWTNSANSYGTAIKLSTSGDDIWLYVGRSTSLNFGIRFYLGSTPLDDTDFLPVNEWVHIVATFKNDDNSMKIYVNGQEKRSFTANKNPGLWNTTSSNQIAASGGGGERMQGGLSQICLFDYALTDGTGGTTDQIGYLYNLNNPMAISGAEPVAYWPLGDNSNPNANAGYPNISTGTDSVFLFSGSQFINVPGSDSLSFGDSVNDSPFSMSAWIKTSSSASKGIISKWGTTGTSGYEWIFWTVGAPAKLRMNLNDGTNLNYRYRQGSTNITTGEWVHAVVTYDGRGGNNANDGIKIYVNGQEESSYTNGSGGTYQAMHNTARQVQIGAYNSVGQFTGEISNAEIWDVVLQPSEVLELYNNGQPLMTGTQPQETNLQSWWKLNQTANWEADTVGNWQIPDNRSAYPQSFNFDGSDDVIDISNSSDFNLGTSFTISGWFNFSYTNATKGLISFDSSSTRGWFLYTLSGNEIRIFDGTNAFVLKTSYTTTGQWDHFVVTYDGTNLVFYINGLQESTQTASVDLQTNGNNGQIGNNQFLTGRFFNGKASNIQLFNTALPATGTDSVETLYNNGTPLTTAIATDNLKAWYKLNDNEKFDGANWSVENQKYPAGFDSSLIFNQTTIGDRVQIPHSTSLDITSNLSVSFWYKQNGVNADASAVSKDAFGSARSWFLWVNNFGGTNFPTVGVFDSSNNPYSVLGTIRIDDGNWHHIVMTYEPSVAVRLYIDGQLNNSNTTSIPASIASEPTVPIVIGESFTSTFYPVRGFINNVAIFNTTLDLSAVVALYNNGTPETSISSSPVSWWKLNNTTTGIQDSIGSNNGSITGNVSKRNIFVSTEAGVSSGMTEQNLVNNNVSALNGESDGMTTTALVQSNLTRTQPFSNYSMFYDAVDVYSTFDTQISLGSSDSFTWSFWIKPVYNSISDMVLVRASTTSITANNTMLLTYSGGNWRIKWDNANGNFQTGYVIPDNEWSHVALSITQGTGTRYAYINGVQQSANAAVTGITSQWLGFSSENTTNDFEGYLSQCAYWDTNLSTTELAALYNNGVPQDLRNFSVQPTQYWPMNQEYSYWDGSVWTNRDIISGNDSTTVNTAVVSAFVGNAPGSEANGSGTNLTIADLKGNMENSKLNAYSINMADYADGVTNPANSGRSTEVPSV